MTLSLPAVGAADAPRFDALYEDAMIAATARRHKLTVVTRNVGDFAHFGVDLFNPFDAGVALPPKL